MSKVNSQQVSNLFQVQVTQTRDVTIAVVGVIPTGSDLEPIDHFLDDELFYGSTKKDPGDKFNADLGRHLASARAFESLARWHRKQARIAENGGG